MNRINIFLLLTLIIGLGLLSYKVTYSLFSDNATSTNNTFTASAEFPTPIPSVTPTPTASPTPTPTPIPLHLVINEIGAQGDSKKGWVELFNPTSSGISISNWTIADDTGSDTLPNITIPAGGYGVIVTSNTQVVVPGVAQTISLSSTAIGGDGLGISGDRVILMDNTSVIIDQLSYGTDITVFNPSVANAPSNESMARSPNGVDTDTTGDWIVDSSWSIGVSN